MQSTSRRVWTLSLLLVSAGSTAAARTCSAQGPSPAHLPAAAQDNTAKANDDTLPSFLLKVPGGDVAAGMEIDAFVQACAEAAFEFNPAKAHVAAKAKFIQAMRRSASVIGRKPVSVPTFYLGKWPVKNREYQTFVDAERAAGRETRPPMHWWKEGAKDEYEKALPDIRKSFPKTENAALLYWERHGHELPYKVQDDKGESIADHPVVFVSWRDANRFAASLGMRLPTEIEMTRAMRGNGTHTWPGGEQEGHDAWSAKKKDLLGMAKTSDLKVKPVGTVTGAAGPFGHLDLFGQVWQLCGDLGFQPIHGDMKGFVKTWDKGLQKHKLGRMLERKPTWRGNYIIAKGGSFLSYQEPVQLMIDARAPMQTTAVFESMGFRLAKSLQPGYDYLYSLQRIQFDSSAFAKNQELAMDKLVGGERYTIADNGFPSAYEAVAFAPANWLYDEKQMRLKTLNEGSQIKPLLLGAIASTAKFENGTAAGLYSVSFRAAGIPKELRDAVKQGHKAVIKARKDAEKAKKSKKKDDEKKKPKKDSKPTKWRMVTKRFGLTEDDLADAKAANGDLGFVRIDEVVIPTDRDSYLLSTKGKTVSVFEGTKKKAAFGDPIPATLSVEPGPKGKEEKAIAKFTFGIPLLARSPKKVVVFHMHAPLDQAPPTPDKPWRLPQE